MAKLGVLVDAQVDFITGALANKFAQAKVPNIVVMRYIVIHHQAVWVQIPVCKMHLTLVGSWLMR